MADTTPAPNQGYGTYGTPAAGTGPVYTPVYSQAYGPYGAVVQPAPTTGIFEDQFEDQFE